MYLYHVEVADRLRAALSGVRTNAGISRRAMSESIHVSESTIKSWENGYGSPTLSVIMEWFSVVGENPFSYMLEFFWPDTIGQLSRDSTDEELRQCLSIYLQEVAGSQEIRKLHYLVGEEYGGSWLGVLDMFSAHIHTGIHNRYKTADIIHTSYELGVANGKVLRPDLVGIGHDLLSGAITAARDATLSHKQGYSMYKHWSDCQSASSSAIRKARQDGNVPASFLAKAMGKTERTIRNWEENTEPTFLDVCVWFHVLGRPLWPYLRSEMLPGEAVTADVETENCRADLLRYFSVCASTELRKLCYLIFWKHGSYWRTLLGLMVEHVNTPLYQRVISARSILIGYEIDSSEQRAFGTLGILPDIENLKACIEKGTQAAKQGQSTY